jgi:hypothetical protein
VLSLLLRDASVRERKPFALLAKLLFQGEDMFCLLQQLVTEVCYLDISLGELFGKREGRALDTASSRPRRHREFWIDTVVGGGELRASSAAVTLCSRSSAFHRAQAPRFLSRITQLTAA